MQQILEQLKISLIETGNDSGYPLYYEQLNQSILANTNVIDVLSNQAYAQGVMTLAAGLTPVVLTNIQYLHLSSSEYFYYSLSNSNYYVKTKDFSYNNMNDIMDSITIYNGYLDYNNNIFEQNSSGPNRTIAIKYLALSASPK